MTATASQTTVHEMARLRPSVARAVVFFACLMTGLPARASEASPRQIVSLDGPWEIAGGKSPAEVPASFPGTVPVPGLANLANPPIINEYGWLWLNRDGTPTLLTEKVYEHLLGPNATARQRLDLYAYLLGAKTEFWRAHRHYAGIIHFVYLTCSYPGVYTADHFSDVTKLQLDPAFADYVGEAFKPLGVYLNFFQPELPGGAAREFPVMMVNDQPEALNGELTLSLETRAGKPLCQVRQPFEIAGLGAQSCKIALPIPVDAAGECVLQAVARAGGSVTVSRRWVAIKEQENRQPNKIP